MESAEICRMARRVVDVLVPVALDRAYSYRVPEALTLAPGDIVCVPLGAREATAVVWAENPKPNPRLDNRLKDVEEKLDVPPLKPELRSFVDWVANYTLASRGMVLRMCLRMGEHLGAERERVGVRLAGAAAAAHDGGARRACWRFSPTAWCAAKGEAAREAGVSRRRDRRPDRRRHAAKRWCCRRSRSRKSPIPISRTPDFTHDQARRRRRAESDRRQGRLFGHAASTASPARARPRSISRRWRRRSGAAGRA